jgi:hypothetical protein
MTWSKKNTKVVQYIGTLVGSELQGGCCKDEVKRSWVKFSEYEYLSNWVSDVIRRLRILYKVCCLMAFSYITFFYILLVTLFIILYVFLLCIFIVIT